VLGSNEIFNFLSSYGVKQNITVLQDETPCITLACLGEICCPYLLGRRDSNDELRNLSRPIRTHNIKWHFTPKYRDYTLRCDVRLTCVTVW